MTYFLGKQWSAPDSHDQNMIDTKKKSIYLAISHQFYSESDLTLTVYPKFTHKKSKHYNFSDEVLVEYGTIKMVFTKGGKLDKTQIHRYKIYKGNYAIYDIYCYTSNYKLVLDHSPFVEFNESPVYYADVEEHKSNMSIPGRNRFEWGCELLDNFGFPENHRTTTDYLYNGRYKKYGHFQDQKIKTPLCELFPYEI